MKQMIVIYQSAYGFSEKYAKWIAKELNCEAIQTKEASLELLKKYEVIIYCGGIYAGRISGFSLIQKNYDALKDKRIAVVAVGVSLGNDTVIEAIKKQNLTSSMEKVGFFYLRGGLDFSKMSWFHRLLMNIRHWMIGRKNKANWDENDHGFMETFGQNVDFISSENLTPILNYILGKEENKK